MTRWRICETVERKMNKQLSANPMLSYYRIVSKIGAGGMGEA